ncbi:cation-transporting P-type ATPase [Clostridium sp. D33t1_170424_F3]|uniref:P-type ATPase n=1 Tax=Clostridium sp. D33t1_170424_F3 TaxID=2787099 RepID=UPI0018A8AD39|nr:cation-transporting P-type ATPase [Clostridium sp. D33t1_170424_F3]
MMTNRENRPYGLTAEQVRIRQTLHGKNDWDRVHKNGVLYRIWRRLRTPGPLLLLLTSCVLLLLEQLTGAAVLFAASVLYVCTVPLLEWGASRTAALWESAHAPAVPVIREGKEQRVMQTDLVPGDLILLCEGMTVPADGILLRADGLSVDESSLPWENTDVKKAVSSDETSGDCCYAGSQILKGRGLLRVEQTGVETVYAQSLHLPAPTAMQKRDGAVLRFCLGIAAVSFLLAFALAFWKLAGTETRLLSAAAYGLTAALAALPVELPLVHTAIFFLHAERLRQNQMPVRNLAAVEKLGEVTALCVDQTGCPFADRTAVRALWALDGDTQNLYELLKEEGEAALSCVFPNGCKLSGQVKQLNGRDTVVFSGTAAELLPYCSLTDTEQEAVRQRETELKKRGLQVAAYAAADGKDAVGQFPLHLIGLIAYASMQGYSEQEFTACRLAGLHTIRLQEASGSGEPEHGAFYCASFCEKRKVVEALKAGGESPAAVGYSAAALKNADLRVAVAGQGSGDLWNGTDIVLLGGKLSAFADAVQEGRRACRAVRQADGLLGAIHLPLVLSAVLFPLFGAFLLPLLYVVLLAFIAGAACLLASVSRTQRPSKKGWVLRGVSLWLACFGSFLAVLWQNPGSLLPALSTWFAALLFAILFLSLSGGAAGTGVWVTVLATVLALAFFLCTPLCQVFWLAPLYDSQLLLALLAAGVAVFWQDWAGGTKNGGKWS